MKRRMSFLTIMLCVVLFDISNSSSSIAATSTPILIVAGKVSSSNGESAPKGLSVIVENQTKNLSLMTRVGDDDGEEGIYIVTFINFEGKRVATTGDNMRVSAKDADGNIVSVETYQLKDEDIDAAYVRIDLKIKALAQSTLTTPIFVVAGSITAENGISAKELLVIVENQTSKLMKKAKISDVKGEEGKYTAIFLNFEGEMVAKVGDVMKVAVQNAIGGIITSQIYQLKGKDIAAAYAIIDLSISKVAVERKGKSYLIWAKLKSLR